MTSGDLTSRACAPHRLTGRRIRTLKPCCTFNSADMFVLDKLAAVDNLHAAYERLRAEGGPGAGIDRLTFDDFSPSEMFAALRQLSRAISQKRYLPYPTRLVLIPKDDHRYRELRLHRITDRTVAKALQLALDPYWRAQLPGIGRGVLHIYADMQRYMRAHKAYVLAIDDVRDCFPSARLDDVLRCHRQRISQPDLLWLIESILRGHDGPDHLTGLDQGSPYSPVAMEALLHDCLDTVLDTRCPGYPLLLRYVDNLTFVCRTERDGFEALETARNTLARLGLSIKGKDGFPKDIRDGNHNTKLLGMIPHWRNGALDFLIPESGFENLIQGLHNAFNHSNGLAACKEIIRGWIDAVGPALTMKAMPEVLDRIRSMARQCGFGGISIQEFQETASRSRKRWIELSQSSAPT